MGIPLPSPNMEFLMRLRPAVVGAVAAVSMFGSACGNPEANEGPSPALDVQQNSEALQVQNALGLGADHSLVARASLTDELNQTHTRYEHFFRGVRVWEGDTVAHNSATGTLAVTGQALADIQVNTLPKLATEQALAQAHALLKPRGRYVQAPTAELVVYPRVVEQVKAQKLRGPAGELNATDIERVVTGHVLAYHVHSALENGADETRHVDYLIDAQTGELLKEWSTLETATATGSGKSQYSGAISLNTNSATSGWELRDVSRGMNYATYNLNHGTSGTGTIYTDADNAWGDGTNYTSGGSTTAANGQTAAVDAHYGIGVTYDYYKNVLGRNGIDGTGKATYNRVHYSSSYDNAFWDDTCFCMTYGDGSSFKVLTSLDVAGHEMTHGVTSRTANLTYSGESGGLNEATSDINGTMVEFYSRGGSGATIGNTGGNWTIGEQLSSTPLRYMYKPSKDGASKDAWSSSLGNLDVHYSSGPMNRAFYFLSQGASSTTSSDFYSSYLPAGMTGVGNDHAARIAFRALTVYETSSTNYAGARDAYLKAATDLYGATSADYAAVQNAFAAINVGTAAGGGGGTGGNSIQNGGFESGAASWTATSGVINNDSTVSHGGSWAAELDGYGSTHTDTLSQGFTVPAKATTLSFWLKITSSETTTTAAYDKLTVQLKNSSGTVLATLGTYSNLNKGSAYAQKTFSVSAYAGQTVQLVFTGTEDSSTATSFFIDDVAVQ
jgi:Zn-dependent metalloprotease